MQRTGLLLVILGLVWIAVAYVLFLTGWARPLSPWLLAFGSTSLLAGIACLGAARRARRAPILTAALVVAFLAVLGGLLIAMALPAPAVDDPLLLGLPRATTLLFVFTGIIPLLLLPIAYAIAFDDEVISDADLEKLRADAAAIREPAP